MFSPSSGGLRPQINVAALCALGEGPSCLLQPQVLPGLVVTSLQSLCHTASPLCLVYFGLLSGHLSLEPRSTLVLDDPVLRFLPESQRQRHYV